MSASFITFDLASGTKETGPIYPQIQKMTPGYNFNAPNSLRQLLRHRKSFPDFLPNLDSFILSSKSKPTDFISNALSSQGIIVNSSVKEILISSKTCPLKFYPISIRYKRGILENYYWMHINSDYTDFIDYKNSLFFIYQNFMHNLGYIKIESKEDLLEKEEKLKKENPTFTLAIWSERIKFLPTFDFELDFFSIGKFDACIYISNRLATLFEEKKFSGYQIFPATKLII